MFRFEDETRHKVALLKLSLMHRRGPRPLDDPGSPRRSGLNAGARAGSGIGACAGGSFRGPAVPAGARRRGAAFLAVAAFPEARGGLPVAHRTAPADGPALGRVVVHEALGTDAEPLRTAERRHLLHAGRLERAARTRGAASRRTGAGRESGRVGRGGRSSGVRREPAGRTRRGRRGREAGRRSGVFAVFRGGVPPLGGISRKGEGGKDVFF